MVWCDHSRCRRLVRCVNRNNPLCRRTLIRDATVDWVLILLIWNNHIFMFRLSNGNAWKWWLLQPGTVEPSSYVWASTSVQVSPFEDLHQKNGKNIETHRCIPKGFFRWTSQFLKYRRFSCFFAFFGNYKLIQFVSVNNIYNQTRKCFIFSNYILLFL